MTTASPRLSVIVPTYRPGTGLNRVVESLDAQTLPQHEFEVVVVDDGSPDDTFERLRALAATRPNYRISQIPNSGWPSRPRNVATRIASGAYVLYMDHDDSLFADGLRRAIEFAEQTDADLVSLKESKTSDPWWCMPSLSEGNSDEIKQCHRIDRLLPMVPHKLYRREFLLANDITFPEGPRQLWEDVYVNVEAYAKAERVALLADAPVYTWHSSASNNSKSYGPHDVEFWDRMSDLMGFIDHTLDTPELQSERRSALLHQYRSRILRRLGKALQSATPEQAELAMARARGLQDRFIPLDWDPLVDPWEYPRAAALRANRADLLDLLHRSYRAFKGHNLTGRVEWVDGQLRIGATAEWCLNGTSPLEFIRQGDRLVMPLHSELSSILDQPAVDVTDILHKFVLVIGVRARSQPVTWQLPLDLQLVQHESLTGNVNLELQAEATFDPETIAGGGALDADVWDFLAVTRWAGLARTGGLKSSLSPRAALLAGLPAVAYASKSGNLAVDLTQRLRSVAADGAEALTPLPMTAAGFAIPLPRVHRRGDTDLPINVRLTADLSTFNSTDTLPASIVADHDNPRVVVVGQPQNGVYRVSFEAATGIVQSRFVLQATDGALSLQDASAEPAPQARSVLKRLRHTIGAWRRTARKRVRRLG